MKQRTIFFLSFAAFISVFFLVMPVLAQDKYGLGDTARSAGLPVDATKTLPSLIGDVIGTGLSLIAVMFFVLMLYGGFLWMTARGSEDQTKKALNTITAAIIGMIVVMASYTITNFVFTNVAVPAPSGGSGTNPSGGGGVGAPINCCVYPDNSGTDLFRVGLDSRQCVDACNAQGNSNLDCATQAQVTVVNSPGECN